MIRNLWPAIVWAVIILIITGVPGSYVPAIKSFWSWLSYDKIVHVGVFAILSFLILHGFRQQYLESKKRYLFVVGAVTVSLAYGLLTEVLQAYVFIGRDGAWLPELGVFSEAPLVAVDDWSEQTKQMMYVLFNTPNYARLCNYAAWKARHGDTCDVICKIHVVSDGYVFDTEIFSNYESNTREKSFTWLENKINP